MANKFHLKTSLIAFFLAIGLVVVGMIGTMASIFVRETENILVQKAQIICAVTVMSQNPDTKPEPILTRFSVKPIQCFKGEAKSDFEVTIPSNGEASKNPRVMGSPKLKIGESSIIFAARENDKTPYVITNWVQGIIPLEKDSSGSFIVSKKHTRHIKPSDEAKGLTLEDYRAHISQVK